MIYHHLLVHSFVDHLTIFFEQFLKKKFGIDLVPFFFHWWLIKCQYDSKKLFGSYPKKLVLLPQIDRVKIYCPSPACIAEYVSEYIFLVKKKKKKRSYEFNAVYVQRE